MGVMGCGRCLAVGIGCGCKDVGGGHGGGLDVEETVHGSIRDLEREV